jgi:hypothetical protein
LPGRVGVRVKFIQKLPPHNSRLRYGAKIPLKELQVFNKKTIER